MQHFNDNHVYLSIGRYQVSLPRKASIFSLGDSRKQALQRFEENEKPVSRKGKWTAFQQVVQEYLDLGHAELIPKTAMNSPVSEHYYLPMHSVTKASSTSTKLRMVNVSSLMFDPNTYYQVRYGAVKTNLHLVSESV